MRNSASSSSSPSSVQGICPNGWHVPSDAEWTIMTDYVSSRSDYQCGGMANYIAQALTGVNNESLHRSLYWQGCNVNCAACDTLSDLQLRNATGFTAAPMGRNYYAHNTANPNLTYDNAQVNAYFWTSTKIGDSVYCRRINQNEPTVLREKVEVLDGLPVRCIKDNDGLAPTSYTITFDVNGGMGSMAAQQISSIGKVNDFDDNKYAVVQFGTQCWMTENLKSKTGEADDGCELKGEKEP